MSERPTQAEYPSCHCDECTCGKPDGPDEANSTNAQEVLWPEYVQVFLLNGFTVDAHNTESGDAWFKQPSVLHQDSLKAMAFKLRAPLLATIAQQKEEIELLNNRLNTDSQDFTIQCLREIEKLLRDQLSATQAREVQQKEEITTMRLERGNKVALLLLDIADEQLKQQALQSELSALQAREVMLVEALEGVRSDLEISCSSADAKRNEIIRNYITEELSLSNSTEHTERFMAEVKAKTLESIPYRVFKDGDSWCAAGCGFINLQESKAGFGDSPLVALGELIVLEGEN